MKNYKYLLIIAILMVSGCSIDRLEPDPLSFFSPENTLIDKAGMDGLIVTLNSSLREEKGQNDGNLLLGEWNYSDFTVNGAPPGDVLHNFELQMTPNSTEDNECIVYWNLAFRSIKNANVIISRAPEIELTASELNEVMAKALFHRSYWYYRLVHQFGDVPFVAEEVTSPKLDFYTHSREAVLQRITKDMEFAVQYLPVDVQPGDVNQAAGSFLLTKCYLSIREFDKAIAEASKVINDGKYALMTERFGTTEPEFLTFSFLDSNDFDVLWDLHQKNNKSLAENTEKILVSQNQFNTIGSQNTAKSRDTSPTWWQARDPNGTRACTDLDYGKGLNMIQQLGRGVGRMVPSQYFRDMRWEDPDDLRYSHNNWFGMERYVYNDPSSAYYGQPFDPASVTDIRQWYPIAYNKLIYIDESGNNQADRSTSDEYIYRLAELYLLRAEAYWWKGDIPRATADVNVVRARAQASLVDAVDLDYIFDERARELYFESPRKTELTRVAYIMASLNRDGYTLENMTTNNWFYDRVMRRNHFYVEEILQGANIYRMLPYHVYWPIKEVHIRENSLGHLNQTPGYPGSETNILPLTDTEQDKPDGMD
ncbi:RagB/SusD family nutrient uptake outer membrane protein [Arenibacter troitsensis]|uniref:Starch-binding associating with outer membrane n=1 Tax=Arenibacter troitsensis TaxID=188872 RepID=A0A1X7IHH9_9FLAO|nr:RagB/SusD family nutrient uptake outer membrane protein [Arenibacter troitsensis]SMG13999.1 Starch-binding associating with outer membrane [Arenibacter troitsensis]